MSVAGESHWLSRSTGSPRQKDAALRSPKDEHRVINGGMDCQGDNREREASDFASRAGSSRIAAQLLNSRDRLWPSSSCGIRKRTAPETTCRASRASMEAEVRKILRDAAKNKIKASLS